MLIRRATVDDAEALVDLLRQLGYPSDVNGIRPRLVSVASSVNDAAFVAVDALGICGLASVHLLPLFHTGGTVARLTALVVDDRVRRQGVGKALVAAIEAYAASAGSVRVELTSGDHRTDAHRFYESIGYQRVSQRFIKQIPSSQA